MNCHNICHHLLSFTRHAVCFATLFDERYSGDERDENQWQLANLVEIGLVERLEKALELYTRRKYKSLATSLARVARDSFSKQFFRHTSRHLGERI